MAKNCYSATYNAKGQFHSFNNCAAVVKGDGDNLQSEVKDNDEDNLQSEEDHFLSEETQSKNTRYDKYWFENGIKHRICGPAVILRLNNSDYNNNNNYTIKWYKNGKKHGDHNDDPAYLKFTNNVWIMRWYNAGLRHRDDGPAVIKSSGIMKWYIHGKLIKSTIDFDLDDSIISKNIINSACKTKKYKNNGEKYLDIFKYYADPHY